MMDLKKLAEDCMALQDAYNPGGALAVRVDIWLQPRAGGKREPKITVEIWDGTRHYGGRSPEEALASFMRELLPCTGLDTVAEVAVPEAAPEAAADVPSDVPY